MIASPNDHPMWRLRRADIWWLLAYPIYQSLGTIRHEGSHALAAIAGGAEITKFVIWPSTDLGLFTWGYVRWSGQTGWIAPAAPYICDLVWFAGFFVVCTRVRMASRALWLNLVIIGLISPLVNSTYQWILSFLRPAADVARIKDAVPAVVVNLYFLLTIAIYVIGLWMAVRTGRQRDHRSPTAMTS